ncbi:hypothetical protein AB0J25_11695 [Streptomyces sp. NPDC049910]|uniref:hypothetical protein n=1 Tax=Streptomyces sp. NPDC049910 TaxID=3155278 RepID=UPI003413B1C8
MGASAIEDTTPLLGKGQGGCAVAPDCCCVRFAHDRVQEAEGGLLADRHGLVGENVCDAE